MSSGIFAPAGVTAKPAPANSAGWLVGRGFDLPPVETLGLAH